MPGALMAPRKSKGNKASKSIAQAFITSTILHKKRLLLTFWKRRYRDGPEQEDYDWAQLGVNVAAGMVVVGSLAALAAVSAALVAGAGAATGAEAVAAAGAAKSMGAAVFLTGSLYVTEQAVSDALTGRLGSTEQYMRKALAGSVVGFLTGASGLMMQGSSLERVLGLGFGEGFPTQHCLDSR